MKNRKLLMISTDRLIFDEKSSVRARQIEYAKEWEEVHIITFKSKVQNPKFKILSHDFLGEQISDNCWVYSTKSLSKFLYPFDAIKIGRKIIREKNISEITCQDPSLTAMAGVALKKKFNLPLEIQIHGDISSPYFAKSISNKIRLFLAKKYLPEADKIRVVSDRIKRYVESLLGCVTSQNRDVTCSDLVPNLSREPDRETHPEIEVRPIFVDVEAIKNSPILVDLKRKYKQFSHIVLMASRLEKEKNIELAIDAWQLVTKSLPNAGLVIVGSGSEELKLKSMVVGQGLTKKVVFETWTDKETLYSYYKTADIFLNTSLFEGYGMTLVEAHSAGCKIISTDVGVAREVGATIIDPDSRDLSRKIATVLRNSGSTSNN